MLARELEITALDFETTGQVRGEDNIPWQFGAACISGGRLAAGPGASIFLRVPMSHSFNPYTPGRWAEIREKLSECGSMQEEWRRISPWLLNRWLLAHNAPTERKMLRNAYPMHQFGPWIDTLRMARAAYPGLKSYSLSDLLETLGIQQRVQAVCPGLAPHDAYYDAVGCACLFEHILSIPGWNDISAEYLSGLKNK